MYRFEIRAISRSWIKERWFFIPTQLLSHIQWWSRLKTHIWHVLQWWDLAGLNKSHYLHHLPASKANYLSPLYPYWTSSISDRKDFKIYASFWVISFLSRYRLDSTVRFFYTSIFWFRSSLVPPGLLKAHTVYKIWSLADKMRPKMHQMRAISLLNWPEKANSKMK